jgi:hypothetical protein
VSGQPLRPVFSEAQVLAGADLTRIVDHAAEAQARHERTLHLWGITQGLELVPEPDTAGAQPFVRVSLSAGAAVDGTGRQIVVAEPVPLDEGAFEQLNGTVAAAAPPDTWFPVFLSGRDEDAPVEGIAPTSCGQQAAPTRVVEGYEVSFGRAGDELELDDQQVPAIDEGPGREGANPWRVLLGFVQWIPNINQFRDVGKKANNISVRYAGAMADEVAARDGRIELRSRVAPVLGTPAAVVDEQEGGRLYFGLHDGAGNVTPLLTVSGQGDVKAEGTISGLLTSGSVMVQSGLATDGVVLPLPEGVTQEQVDKGQVALHFTATPRVPPSAAPSGKFAWVPKECFVDADRRVRCLVTWFSGFATADREDRPATCDYVVMAAAASKGGP